MSFQITLNGEKAKHYRLVSLTRESQKLVFFCKNDSYRPEEKIFSFREVKA